MSDSDEELVFDGDLALDESSDASSGSASESDDLMPPQKPVKTKQKGKNQTQKKSEKKSADSNTTSAKSTRSTRKPAKKEHIDHSSLSMKKDRSVTLSLSDLFDYHRSFSRNPDDIPHLCSEMIHQSWQRIHVSKEGLDGSDHQSAKDDVSHSNLNSSIVFVKCLFDETQGTYQIILTDLIQVYRCEFDGKSQTLMKLYDDCKQPARFQCLSALVKKLRELLVEEYDPSGQKIQRSIRQLEMDDIGGSRLVLSSSMILDNTGLNLGFQWQFPFRPLFNAKAKRFVDHDRVHRLNLNRQSLFLRELIMLPLLLKCDGIMDGRFQSGMDAVINEHSGSIRWENCLLSDDIMGGQSWNDLSTLTHIPSSHDQKKKEFEDTSHSNRKRKRASAQIDGEELSESSSKPKRVKRSSNQNTEKKPTISTKKARNKNPFISDDSEGEEDSDDDVMCGLETAGSDDIEDEDETEDERKKGMLEDDSDNNDDDLGLKSVKRKPKKRRKQSKMDSSSSSVSPVKQEANDDDDGDDGGAQRPTALRSAASKSPRKAPVYRESEAELAKREELRKKMEQAKKKKGKKKGKKKKLVI